MTAQRSSNRDAPGAAGTAVEGEITFEQKEVIMNMVTLPGDREAMSPTEESREWAAQYLAQRKAATDLIELDPTFQTFAAEQAATSRWDHGNCVDLVLHDNWEDALSLPAELLPSWAQASEPSWTVLGGEVSVLLFGREHIAGTARARLFSCLSIVVGDNRDGAPIGTVYSGSIDIDVTDVSESAIDEYHRVEDTAQVLASLAVEMRAVVKELGSSQ